MSSGGPAVRPVETLLKAQAFGLGFDLAGIIAYHDLDGAGTAALLQGYGHHSMGDLDAWVVLFDLVRCLWMDVADAWGLLPEAGRGALLARLRR